MKNEEDARMVTMGDGDTSRTASEDVAGSQRSPTPNQVNVDVSPEDLAKICGIVRDAVREDFRRVVNEELARQSATSSHGKAIRAALYRIGTRLAMCDQLEVISEQGQVAVNAALAKLESHHALLAALKEKQSQVEAAESVLRELVEAYGPPEAYDEPYRSMWTRASVLALLTKGARP